MQKRRDCVKVIEEMLKYIPTDKTELIKDLNWNRTDSMYKAPEETLQWERTMHTLQSHIPTPLEDWEFEVVSIFTLHPVDILKESVAKELKSQEST